MDSKTSTLVDSSKTLVYGSRVSSAVPAMVTGNDRVLELTGLDLAMKLHYLRGVYFFDKEAVVGLTIYDLKKAMFAWLIHFFTACGRIRISDDEGNPGRPYIKLNDGGLRIIEAQCSMRLEGWLAMEECCSLSDELLVYQHSLGLDLLFTPLVLIQFTWFKCGGVSVGLSWAHVLGDPLSVMSFMELLGRFLRPNPPSKQLALPELKKSENQVRSPTQGQDEPSIPLSIKRVNPVGLPWVPPATSIKMVSHTLIFSRKNLDRLRSSIREGPTKFSRFRTFDLVTAAIWKSVARVRGESATKAVTVCRFRATDRGNQIPQNDGEICGVEANSTVDLSDLVAQVAENAVDESAAIGEAVDREIGVSEFVVYGARLTFVDLEGEDLYGFEIKGKKPVFVNFTIGGAGEGGVVLVMPAPEEGGGRVVTMVLPENEIKAVKKELKCYV